MIGGGDFSDYGATMIDDSLPLDAFIAAFAAAFGERAVLVAATQRDLGSGAARERWSQIVDALTAPTAVGYPAGTTGISPPRRPGEKTI